MEKEINLENPAVEVSGSNVENGEQTKEENKEENCEINGQDNYEETKEENEEENCEINGQNDDEEDIIDKSAAIKELILKELAHINGRINKMTTNELISKLQVYKLDTNGTDEVKKKRLKQHYRKIKLSSANMYLSNQLIPFYVIVDFEATCEQVKGPDYVHEIIEFPAVLVNSNTQEIEATFQKFCKPQLKPNLSSFCTELTGITQEQVDNADSFVVVLKQFEDWLHEHKLFERNKFVIATDGPWDMCRFLYSQCVLSEVSYPTWAKTWLNVRKAYSNFYRSQRFNLQGMLEHSGLCFEGRPHCGLDDAKNIARILVRLICDGASLAVNERIAPEKHGDRSKRGEWEGSSADKPSMKHPQAFFISFQNKSKLGTYEQVKRDRSIREQKIGRAIAQGLPAAAEGWQQVSHRGRGRNRHKRRYD